MADKNMCELWAQRLQVAFCMLEVLGFCWWQPSKTFPRIGVSSRRPNDFLTWLPAIIKKFGCMDVACAGQLLRLSNSKFCKTPTAWKPPTDMWVDGKFQFCLAFSETPGRFSLPFPVDVSFISSTAPTTNKNMRQSIKTRIESRKWAATWNKTQRKNSFLSFNQTRRVKPEIQEVEAERRREPAVYS